jgi:hypothetical protein
MIIEHQIKGSKETSFHDLQIQVSILDITLLSGSYFQKNVRVFTLSSNTTISIPQSNTLTYYEIWITKNGISVLVRGENEDFPYGQLVDQIDRICWFSVPANCTDLSNVDIHLMKVVE